MQAVNKKMDPQKTLKTMQDFQKENMKMGMMEETSKTLSHTHTQRHTKSPGIYRLTETRLPGWMWRRGVCDNNGLRDKKKVFDVTHEDNHSICWCT